MFRSSALKPRWVNLALLATVIMVIPITGATAAPTERVIVVLEESPAAPADVASDLAETFGGRIMRVYEHAIRGFAIEIPAPALAGLARAPGVAWIEPDIEISVAQSSAQPLPTHLDRIESDLNPPANPVPVNIAIIDTGVQIDHPDLNVRYVTDCTGAIFYPLLGGCTGNSSNLGDQNGHGTHVAGLAAACDNDIGTIGAAPCAEITSVKVLDASGSGPLSSILAGLDIVAANASLIDVANASWGFEGGSQALTDSVNSVVAAGVVFIAAAGNSAQEIATFAPASVPDAITVTAVADFDGKPGGLGAATCRDDVDDTLADFSNYGAGADIAAPGVCLYSSYLNSGYAVASGTSMASPVVAGAAARYIAENGKPTNRTGVIAVRDALVNGAFSQSGTCGFTDVDGLPEPLLSANGSAFGGPGGCESVTGGNQPPTASFTYDCNDLACTFNGTGSSDDAGITLFSWDFGDESAAASGSIATHTFGSAGDYGVTLTVTDGEGLSDSVTQTVSVAVAPPNQPPTAGFSADCPDLNCTFNSSAASTDEDGSVVGWQWDFGDGTTSDQQNPSHTFSASGSHDVTLTVIDDDGAASAPFTETITVPNGVPSAAFTFDCPDLTCTFDASTSTDDGGIVSYEWAFGDGGGATGQTAEHTYGAAGTYSVSLTVTDGEAAQSSTTQQVPVAEAPPIVMTTANIGYVWNTETREGTVLLSVVTMADDLFVDGATVSGYWTWENKGGKPATMEVTAVSDGSNLGLAEIVTVFKKNQTPVEFCVTDVVKDGYEYSQTDPVCAREFPS